MIFDRIIRFTWGLQANSQNPAPLRAEVCQCLEPFHLMQSLALINFGVFFYSSWLHKASMEAVQFKVGQKSSIAAIFYQNWATNG